MCFDLPFTIRKLYYNKETIFFGVQVDPHRYENEAFSQRYAFVRLKMEERKGGWGEEGGSHCAHSIRVLHLFGTSLLWTRKTRHCRCISDAPLHYAPSLLMWGLVIFVQGQWWYAAWPMHFSCRYNIDECCSSAKVAQICWFTSTHTHHKAHH